VKRVTYSLARTQLAIAPKAVFRAVKMWILFTLAAIASWVSGKWSRLPVSRLGCCPRDTNYRRIVLSSCSWRLGLSPKAFSLVSRRNLRDVLLHRPLLDCPPSRMAQVKSFAAENHHRSRAHGRAPASTIMVELGRRNSLDERRLPVTLRPSPSPSATIRLHRRFAT